MHERTRERLDRLPPEQRAKAEAALARQRTPEARERERQQRAALDAEYRATGTIATIPDPDPASQPTDVRWFLAALRRERQARGLSLDQVAARSGMDKAALSRLEGGSQPNPTVATLTRYAAAIGCRIAWGLLPADDEGAPAVGT